MRSSLVILFSIISITLNAQPMNIIKETVSSLFIATDNKDWNTTVSIFADQVELDYSSMNGNPAVTLSPKEIIDNWKTILPGFTHTHHQVGNFITKVDEAKAEVFCYGTATHYLANEGGNIWTVVGSYDFELQQEGSTWRITKMKFNFKYQDGNTSLPQVAIENCKTN